MGESKPHWILAALGVSALAAVSYVAASGGPEKAWLGIRSTIWGHPPPKLIDMQPDQKDESVFFISIRNPATEDVVVTGYRASPIEMSAASMNAIDENAAGAVEGGGGAAPVVTADEQEPDVCQAARTVRLPRPIIVEPGKTVAVRIRPWDQACPFQVKVFSDHGTSNDVDTFTATLERMGVDENMLQALKNHAD